MQSLNLSSTLIETIPLARKDTSFLFPSLNTLILLHTRVEQWRDIDAIESWTSGRLKSLRISLFSRDISIEGDPPPPLADKGEGYMTGKAILVRPILIAQLPGLEILNSTPISAAERRDAEMWYVSYVSRNNQNGEGHEWGRYGELKEKYGMKEGEKVVAKPAGLRSKMISEYLTIASTRQTDQVQPCIVISCMKTISIYRSCPHRQYRCCGGKWPSELEFRQ